MLKSRSLVVSLLVHIFFGYSSALLFTFDKKLFYPFVLRTISTFNRYAYCVVARSVVNIQH